MALATADVNNGRQYPLAIYQAFDYADFTTAVAAAVAELPVNAIVTGGFVVITTAWDSSVSDAGAITGGGVTATIADMQATGITSLTLTGVVQSSGDNVDLTWTGSGTDPTQGAGHIVVEYIITSRANENQP